MSLSDTEDVLIKYLSGRLLKGQEQATDCCKLIMFDVKKRPAKSARLHDTFMNASHSYYP